jgi:hypothetical protein
MSKACIVLLAAGVNVAVSVLTDGAVKTAGSGLAQLFWNFQGRWRRRRLSQLASANQPPSTDSVWPFTYPL